MPRLLYESLGMGCQHGLPTCNPSLDYMIHPAGDYTPCGCAKERLVGCMAARVAHRRGAWLLAVHFLLMLAHAGQSSPPVFLQERNPDRSRRFSVVAVGESGKITSKADSSRQGVDMVARCLMLRGGGVRKSAALRDQRRRSVAVFGYAC